ncbi:gamma-glutamyl-gamma-aminobutyrate hydrolase family protein [Neobacillus piezotolerans]|uniref:Gamma-glutamyl-gamma-aminobutyrate hydrolase family protein n=1 Tax=Neobacillus piezotolerans TaxID=2259171 RepID=A0A3D8GUZ8_9BACI|nr:gamma-glutamyl-gamma-aminobutyrate hydrolase family protein [Neobacillus piezotolerans]RDU38247.1 gamma-glutamyl-gamma-aminobutyrate hydrolase family protein [Neobacillus piezotolerans]
MRKPVIGITAAYVKHNENMEGVYVHHDYHKTVAANGGIPIILPYINPEMAFEMLGLVDAVILSGGEDVDPNLYGQDPQRNLGRTILERDLVEIAIAKYAIEHDTPLLGICRGSQILNVALGGTLIQDIPSQAPESIQHTQKVARNKDSHWVSISPDSKLHQILGTDRVRVNSIHHQALDKVADDLRVVARSADGIVEAVEYAKPSRFTVGVQWHPESLAPNDEAMNRLFKEFIASSAMVPVI